MAKDCGDLLSLRFKYGTQTVFLFVDPLAAFSTISESLLDVLRQIYPDGLAVSDTQPRRTPVPAKGEEYRVVYALAKNPKDLSYGWKPLSLGGSETPASLKLRENTALAFYIQQGDAMEDEPSFEVAIPSLDDEE